MELISTTVMKTSLEELSQFEQAEKKRISKLENQSVEMCEIVHSRLAEPLS